jgi:hypothetical protein
VSWGPCRVSASPFERSKTHREELKPTTSLCEKLEESEVCQFGGFPPRKKSPGFFTFRFTWIFLANIRRSRILSHSASNFLINQTRSKTSTATYFWLGYSLCVMFREYQLLLYNKLTIAVLCMKQSALKNEMKYLHCFMLSYMHLTTHSPSPPSTQ